MAFFLRVPRTALLSMMVLLTLTGAAGAEDYLKYQFTGVVAVLTNATPATVQRMNDAGMGVGAACVATAYVDPNAVDENAEVNKSSFQSDYISFSIGDSAPLFEASDFQRDSYVSAQLGISVAGIPFPISGFGWAGSEPATVSGPDFLSFDAQAESAPGAGDGKGHLVALGGFSAALSSVELPTSAGDLAGLTLIKKLYVDAIDVDGGNAPFQIDCNLVTIAVTLEPPPVVAAVPLSGEMGLLVLMLLMVGTGAFMARGLGITPRR